MLNKFGFRKGSSMSDNIVEIDIIEIAQLLLKKWLLILICVLIGSFGSFLVSKFLIVKQYESEAIVYIENSDSQAEIVSACLVFAETNDTLTEVISILDLSYTVEELEKMITVTSILNTYMIDIAVINENPELSVEIIYTLADVMQTNAAKIFSKTTFEFVDYPIVSDEATLPNYLKNIIIGAGIGFAICSFILVVKKYSNKKIESVHYVKAKYKDIPILGIVPVIKD